MCLARQVKTHCSIFQAEIFDEESQNPLLSLQTLSIFLLVRCIVPGGLSWKTYRHQNVLQKSGRVPEDIRKKLNLKAGSQFVVIGDKDVVILKAITPPPMEEFDTLIAEARRKGKQAGLKKSDIRDAIDEVRKK
jgi:bifunctional DNA-binding transcriptional regulator/antitoxin component of YhaV-PrlF toxin-antitoxin module